MVLGVIGISAILAGVIQNIAGFGASIVMLLVLPRFFDFIITPALNAAICMGMTVIMSIRYRKYIQIKKIWLPSLCFMISSVGIIWFVKDIEMHVLGVAFGILLILLSVYFVFFPQTFYFKPSPAMAIAFGLFAGFLSGLFAIGATVMALYFLSVSEDRNSYMGNLQPLLAVNNTIATVARITRGIYTTNLILPTLIGFFGILIGQKLGSRIAGKMNAKKLTTFIYFIIGITGVETLIKQLSFIA